MYTLKKYVYFLNFTVLFCLIFASRFKKQESFEYSPLDGNTGFNNIPYILSF